MAWRRNLPPPPLRGRVGVGVRGTVRGIGALLLLFALGACGFTPLHIERAAGGGASPALAQVAVEPLEGRIGYELRNRLLDRLSPSGTPAAPRYLLRLKLHENSAPLAVQLDARVTRYNLTLDASYQMLDARQGTVLFTGNARAIGSYNVVDSPFATESSRISTGVRAARTLADDIEAQLAARFGG
ncbi:MAG: hypothetical protein EXQ96_03085 [Alphaproteobacteria bacterium]|nr:hypothetical protein [Alphaproteobacteria bacterium]